jgi:hypothetical protein
VGHPSHFLHCKSDLALGFKNSTWPLPTFKWKNQYWSITFIIGTSVGAEESNNVPAECRHAKFVRCRLPGKESLFVGSPDIKCHLFNGFQRGDLVEVGVKSVSLTHRANPAVDLSRGCSVRERSSLVLLSLFVPYQTLRLLCIISRRPTTQTYQRSGPQYRIRPRTFHFLCSTAVRFIVRMSWSELRRSFG